MCLTTNRLFKTFLWLQFEVLMIGTSQAVPAGCEMFQQSYINLTHT